MSNHFHVLVRVPEKRALSDAELLRRFKVLYPKPTKYQTAEFARLEKSLEEGDADTLLVRERLLSRMRTDRGARSCPSQRLCGCTAS